MSLLHVLNFDSVPTLHEDNKKVHEIERELFGENKIIKFPNEHAYVRCKCFMLL